MHPILFGVFVVAVVLCHKARFVIEGMDEDVFRLYPLFLCYSLEKLVDSGCRDDISTAIIARITFVVECCFRIVASLFFFI